MKTKKNRNYQAQIREVLQQEIPELAARAMVEVRSVSSPTIQKLNRTYRIINEPTDVLSFPTYSYQEIQALVANPTSPEEPILLGSIVLCEKIIEDRAKKNHQTIEQYTDWAIRHGVKHLLGYDHDPSGETWHLIQ